MVFEPRSWEPELRIEPLNKARPTNSDIAKLANQIHDCLEDHRAKTEASFVEVKADVSMLKEKLLSRKTVATSSTFAAYMRSVWAVLTAFGTLLLAYKAWTIVWPPLDAAIRSGRL